MTVSLKDRKLAIRPETDEGSDRAVGTGRKEIDTLSYSLATNSVDDEIGIYDRTSSSLRTSSRNHMASPGRNLLVKYTCACCKRPLADREEFDLVKKEFERKVEEIHQILSRKERQKYNEVSSKYKKELQKFKTQNQHLETISKELNVEIKTQNIAHKSELHDLKKSHKMTLDHAHGLYKAQILANQRSRDNILSDQLKEMARNYSRLVSDYERDIERSQRAQEESKSMLHNAEIELARLRGEFAAKLFSSSESSGIPSHQGYFNSNELVRPSNDVQVPPSNIPSAGDATIAQQILLSEEIKQPPVADILEQRAGPTEEKMSNTQENLNKIGDEGIKLPEPIPASVGGESNGNSGTDDSKLRDNSTLNAKINIVSEIDSAATDLIATPAPGSSPELVNTEDNVFVPLSTSKDNSSAGSLPPSASNSSVSSEATAIPENEADIENKKGLDLVKEGFYPDAHLCFEKSVQLDPKNAKAWYNFGLSHTNVTKSYKDALVCFEKAAELEPQNAEAWNNKGAVLAILDKDEEAMMAYMHAVELVPNNSKAWMNMMFIYEKHGDKKAAKECFMKSIEASLHI